MKKLAAPLLAATIGLSAALGTAPTASAAESLKEIAHQALIAYTKATLAGRAALAPMLTPEFQIMRSNGVGYGRDDYLASLHRIKGKPDFSQENIVATRHGDIMVVRYFLRIDEVIDGKQIRKRAPRLTVFRYVDGRWKVVSHANFGAGK